jgi:hypothetical protein
LLKLANTLIDGAKQKKKKQNTSHEKKNEWQQVAFRWIKDFRFVAIELSWCNPQ